MPMLESMDEFTMIDNPIKATTIEIEGIIQTATITAITIMDDTIIIIIMALITFIIATVVIIINAR